MACLPPLEKLKNQNVLAWGKSASRRARGWAGENIARNRGSTRLPWKTKWGSGKTRAVEAAHGSSLLMRNQKSLVELARGSGGMGNQPRNDDLALTLPRLSKVIGGLHP